MKKKDTANAFEGLQSQRGDHPLTERTGECFRATVFPKKFLDS